MRLDSVSAPKVNTDNQINVKTASGKEIALSEGDIVEARVISVRGDSVSLKSADGEVIRARLEGGVALTPGSDATLAVIEKADGLLVMTPISQVTAATAQLPTYTDPALAAMAKQLSAFGFAPNAETVDAMAKILADFPALPAEEAAFIAGQKLPVEPGVMSAVHALFAEGADTGTLMKALISAASPEPGALPQAPAGSEPRSAPLPPPPGQNHGLPPAAAGPAGNVGLDALEAAIARAAAKTEASVLPQAGQEATEPAAAAQLPDAGIVRFGDWLSRTLGMTGQGDEMSGGALAESPGFAGIPARNLAGMAESLTRIAESMPELSSETELFKSIESFARELLLRLDGGSADASDKLREAREELYVKLAYFKDAVAASSSPARDVVLEQTQKLMDHTRLLAGLDQFVCLQLPVRLGEERGRAELYIYKKEERGRRRIDPEDAKILLALDLEHMGHLEAFVEVKGREVSLRFDAPSEAAAAVFRQNTTRLHELLDECGYKFAGASVVAKKEETRIETALLSLIAHEEGRSKGLNFTI